MTKRLEKQLVIHCARTHMDEERIRAVRRLLEDGDLDWDYILENRSFYRISPLLLRNLKEIAHESTVPPSVMDTLAARYVYIFYRNMRIYDILREVLDRFRDEGIPVILLKGVALGETVYSDIDLRPPGDIDLLVRQADLKNAAEILLEMGYSQADPMEQYKNQHHMPPYVKLDEEPDESISIEIHHNIAPEPLMSRIRAEELWEDAKTVNVAGTDALILCPENLILHLCVHLSSDCFVAGIGNLVDISESIRNYDENIDWDCVVTRSNEFGLGSFTYYPLSLAKEMMGAEVPASVLERLKLDPELKPFMVRLLWIVIKRNLSTNHDLRFYASLCRGLFSTPIIRREIGNVRPALFRAFDRAFQKCVQKSNLPGVL